MVASDNLWHASASHTYLQSFPKWYHMSRFNIRPLLTSTDLEWPQMVSYTQSQYESNIQPSRGFQKGVTCLGSVHSQCWPLTASSDLKWPRILKIPTHSFLVWSQLFKNIVVEKSQKFHFLQPIYFWKAGVEPFSDLLKFFRSEVIWGR